MTTAKEQTRAEPEAKIVSLLAEVFATAEKIDALHRDEKLIRTIPIISIDPSGAKALLNLTYDGVIVSYKDSRYGEYELIFRRKR